MITKSQRSGVEKKGCSSVCCRVWVLQCSVVAVGCYGQTAKAVMHERVSNFATDCIELCVVAIKMQTRDVDVNESKARKEKKESKR